MHHKRLLAEDSGRALDSHLMTMSSVACEDSARSRTGGGGTLKLDDMQKKLAIRGICDTVL